MLLGMSCGSVSPANTLCFSSIGTGNCPSLNMNTTFCACIIWSSLAISYASIINYSIKHNSERCCCETNVSIFTLVIFFFSTVRRGLFLTMGNSTLHLFFLIFFASDLSIPCDCWWWCFPQVFRFDCFCQRLSDVIPIYQRQGEDGLVLVHGSL